MRPVLFLPLEHNPAVHDRHLDEFIRQCIGLLERIMAQHDEVCVLADFHTAFDIIRAIQFRSIDCHLAVCLNP